MGTPVTLLVCSDIHYASEAEKLRGRYEIQAIKSRVQRTLVRLYRHFIWLRDPFAHNSLLDRVLEIALEPDLAIANGDYSCDSAFIGVVDPAARQSAQECLGKLRARFGKKFRGVFGDHELGKISLCSGQGGLRWPSFQVAQDELGLKPIWTERFGRYVLVAVTSTLAAMPVYEREALPQELGAWREAARQHLLAIEAVFNQLKANDKVLLFCHDPTALPFLGQIEALRARMHQIERTIIGHLHSDVILKQSRWLSGIPKLTSCGPTVRRISSALSKASEWRHFNLLLCPSLAGLEITRKGGFYTITVDPDGIQKAEFRLHIIKR